ncbi:MAG: hypothetical protein AB8G22_08370 [Saprospiraceae bacterium]
MKKRNKPLEEKIFLLLNALSQKEKNELSSTLLSRNNTKPKLYEFTTAILNFLKNSKEGDSLDYEALHNIVAKPNTPFTQRAKSVSDYKQYLYEFLLDFYRHSYKNENQDEVEIQLEDLLAIQRRPSLFSMFLARADRIEEALKKNAAHDIKYYDQLNQLYNIVNRHSLLNNSQRKSEVLTELIKYEHQLFLAKTIKRWCEIVNLNNLGLSIDPQLSLISLEHILNTSFIKYSSSYFYQQLTKLLRKEADTISSDKDFLTEFSQHITNLRRKEADDIIGIFYNRCNLLAVTSADGLEYEQLASKTSCMRYEKDLIDYKNQGIKLSIFLNIAIAGLRVRPLSWTEDFVRTTRRFLKKETKSLALKLIDSRVDTAKGNHIIAYHTIYKLYQKEKLTRNFGLGLLIRWTLIKACYELIFTESEEDQLLDKHIHAFRQWLKSQNDGKKSHSDRIDSYHNAINYIKALRKTNLLDKAAKQMLLKKIMQEKNLAGKNWFIKKLT